MLLNSETKTLYLFLYVMCNTSNKTTATIVQPSALYLLWSLPDAGRWMNLY